MRTREWHSLVPGLARLVRTLAEREHECRLLTDECLRLAAENYRLKATTRPPRACSTPGSEQPPLPPAVLRLMVAGTDDAEWFLAGGKLGAASLTSLLSKHGIPIAGLERILDFGCGCGRVLQHLPHDIPELYGCDTNPLAVDWCVEHLPFARFALSALGAPLDYATGSFDLVYALSVFTHLPQSLQATTLGELRRVLKAEGLLMLSLRGDASRGDLSRAERAAYDAGALVVRAGELAGTNRCAAFHPPAFVRGAFNEGFDVVDLIPEGARGNPPQDAWLLRKVA